MCVPATNLPLGVQGSLLFLPVLECTLWCAGVQFIFFPSVTINSLTDITGGKHLFLNCFLTLCLKYGKAFNKQNKIPFVTESLSMMPKLVSDFWTQGIFSPTQVAAPVVSHTPGFVHSCALFLPLPASLNPC